MKNLTRRHLCASLAAVAASPGLHAQPPATAAPAPAAPVQPAAPATLGAARAIPFDQMPSHPTASGGESRTIAHGTLVTGEKVNLHQSMQPPGAVSGAPHVIQHTEFILIREGDVEFQHEVAGEMVAERAGPGGVFYVAPGTKHALKNVGTVPARYFVVAIGGDAR